MLWQEEPAEMVDSIINTLNMELQRWRVKSETNYRSEMEEKKSEKLCIQQFKAN